MKSDKYCIFCIKTTKSLKKFATIYSSRYNHGRNMIVIRDLKAFYFNFHWAKDVNENLKREIKFIIQNNESLAENKIKKHIEQLLLKYKHGNNINEYGKQQNE